MIRELFIIFLLTLVPTFELRASIPYGIIALNSIKYGWAYASLFAVIVNIVLGPVVYIVIERFILLLRKIKIIDLVYNKKINYIQKKIAPKLNIKGKFFLSIFIGIPLPGTGSYTGALAAYILGYKKKDFFWINLFGVVLAGIIVTIITITGMSVFSFLS